MVLISLDKKKVRYILFTIVTLVAIYQIAYEQAADAQKSGRHTHRAFEMEHSNNVGTNNSLVYQNPTHTFSIQYPQN
ncbi:MAG: hypothetical protein WA421_09760 [Nitrososphaeraceae archaeon]